MIPHGWNLMTVGQLAADEPGALTDGPFGSNLKTAHYTEAGPRVVRLQNIGDGVFRDERAHITEEHFAKLSKHSVRAEDVLVAMLGEKLPRACLAPASLGPAIVKADCARLRVNEAVVSPRFVMHLLNSPVSRRAAADLVHGVGRPRLGLGLLRALEVHVASRDEQDRIVAAIDSYFSRLDDATATLERLERNLERYRASVLKAAVEGRLVPTEAELARAEGRDYEPASELLKRILVERRRRWEETELAKLRAKGKEPKNDRWKTRYRKPAAAEAHGMAGLPEGWCLSSVDAAGDVLLGRRRAPEYSGKERAYLRVANVRDDWLDLSIIKKMPFDDEHFERHRLLPGDVLVSEGQSPELIGQSAIFPAGLEDMCFQSTLHRFRAHYGLIRPEFAQLVFRSYVKTGVFRRFASITTNIAHLVLNRFKVVPIPLPPWEEQGRIVAAASETLAHVCTRCHSLTRSSSAMPGDTHDLRW